jgi:CheY-like chemotaxis protein
VPVQRAQESELRHPSAELEEIIELEPGQPEYRILVVDDEPENWMVLERLLERAGFSVQVAVDGEMAVQKFADWRPHFIWMDLRMPLIDGAEATRRIRALEGGPEVKIAAVTASAVAGGREEAFKAGMDDYLRKPYRHAEIFECMGRHLGVRYRRRATPAKVAAAEPNVTLHAADVVDIPVALRAELRESIIALDADRISGAIRKISERDAALGAILAQHASHYSYTPMLDAIGMEAEQDLNASDEPPLRRNAATGDESVSR